MKTVLIVYLPSLSYILCKCLSNIFIWPFNKVMEDCNFLMFCFSTDELRMVVDKAIGQVGVSLFFIRCK